MKIRKFYITLICAVLAMPLFADNFKESTDNWLQSNNNMRTDNWLQTETWLQSATAAPTTDGQTTTDLPIRRDGPISDSPFFFLLLGGLAYGAYAIRKRNVKTA